ncbi:Eco57I restriction-modification methylase domain-containing protein [Natrarchaeobius chitinivorans]|uniref:site-specific DNA-methyltransferase (adenine-specific) n=1 Tax=Natrarchaeobius chitinivorans TaxID=1679083 RepID=A0A3N6LRM4_NATCH|nr:TaqI-like C-terminal specificity domain-containing protein [Natrarchaeobius chitinivorans]RQG91067.1 restriction endonuclease [Natrarchaeobius chitinivorans]
MYTPTSRDGIHASFSEYFLEDRLQETTAWAEIDEDELRTAHDEVAAVWGRERPAAPGYDRAELEESLVEPILRALDVPFVRVGRETPSDRPRRRPQYALGGRWEVAAESAVTAPEPADESDEPFGNAVAVADVRRWGRPLESLDFGRDGKGDTAGGRGGKGDTAGGRGGKGDTADDGDDRNRRFEDDHDRRFEHPGHRMRVFLEETAARWGVLTDGKRWRLYGEDDRLGAYSEVDLEEVLEADDPAAFARFYFLFGGGAFREDASGECRLDIVSRERGAVSRELAVDLRDDLCGAIVERARSRLERQNDGNGGDYDFEEDCGDEGGTDDGSFENETLEDVRDDAVRDVVRGLLSRILDRDDAVCDEWDRPLGSRGDGTVDSVRDGAVDCVSTSDRLDRDRLEVHHVREIYEELLGYDLAVAEEERTLAAGEYVGTAGTVSGTGDGARIDAGEVYLTADSGERKANGSYYTPEHVVEYVVEHTLTPLLEEIRDGLDRSAPTFADEFAEEVLDCRILDPAMGTGRFLESVAAFLVGEIVRTREHHAARHGLEAVDPTRDVDWARRRVTARCLYGVDLDPVAVGLARTSLWVQAAGTERTQAVGTERSQTTRTERTGPELEAESESIEDLSGSLEENLVVGNGVVGSDLEAVDELPTARADGAVEPDGEGIGRRDSNAATLQARLEAIANVETAREFDDATDDRCERIPDGSVKRLVDVVADDDAWGRLTETSWFETAQRRADANRYVHWPLEFPGAFGGVAAFPSEGFDAVVGNPPWVATAGRTGISASIDDGLRSYLAGTFEATDGQFDLYVAFYERAVRLSRDGRVGFVVPDSILTREQNEPIREFLLEHAPPSRIVRVGTAFDGVEAGAVVLISDGRTDEVACADATDGGELTDLSYVGVPVDVFRRQPATRFLLYLDETTRAILDRVDDHPPLSTVADVARGEEVSKRAAFLQDDPGAETRPIAPGSAIVRYGVDESELRHVDPDALEKSDDRYRSPKLLFRQTSDSFVGAFDPDGLASIKSAYSIHCRSDVTPESDPVDAYKHVLGVLNAPLANFYLHYRYAAYRSVFPQINQSTFEAFPLAMADGPDPDLVDAVDERLRLTAERSGISPSVGDHLGEYRDGQRLGELPSCRPAAGVEETPLTATTGERSGLRIDSVDVDGDGDGDGDEAIVVISVRLRYKPDDGRGDTDRWGYVTTEPVRALRFDGVDDDTAGLLETFVPYAVAESGGFAGFRANATQTISPLERLRSLTLPRRADVDAGLDTLLDERERAAELDERIAAADRRIHDRVCSRYGLSGAERDVVYREFGEENGGSG